MRKSYLWTSCVLAAAIMMTFSSCQLKKSDKQTSSSNTESSGSSTVEEERSEQQIQKPQEPSKPDEKEEIKQTVRDAMDSLKNLELDKVDRYFTGIDKLGLNISNLSNMTPEDREAVTQVTEHFSYTLGEVEVKGDSAVVQMDITNKDFSGLSSSLVMELAPDAIAGTLDKAAILKKFTQAAKASESNSVTTPVEAPLKLVSGKWKVEITEPVADAITGGLVSDLQGMLSQVESLIPGGLNLFTQK